MNRWFAIAALSAALVVQPIASKASPQQDGASASVARRDGLEEARAIIGDIQKIVTPNGVDETLTLNLGGARQVVNIRGNDRANPVLIYIHGGPGSVEMPMAWSFQRPWEEFFTVVQWDQRGAGRSYPLNDPAAIAPTLSLERYRDDAIELIEQLRSRFGQRKVFVLGHSFGSAVGLAVTQKRPDLLYAYIGMGQLIDFRENERVGIESTLKIARERGDKDAVEAISALSPYPDGGAFTIEKADAWRKYANRYGSLAGLRPDANFYFNSTRLSPLYTPDDRKAWGEGSGFTVATLWPRLADVSFSRFGKAEAPVIFLLGRRDSTTPSTIAAAWLDRLSAPTKTVCWFESSGHLPMVEEPGRTFMALLGVRRLADGAPARTAFADARSGCKVLDPVKP
ncbi:alpha/beta hydrolase [Caulobacter sp. BP25]|nr:alpha/beta hydrolase [Caulobacter sp. BP25]